MELFQRVKRRVELTVPGERYLTAIQSALDDIDEATRKLQAMPNAGAVNLSVAPAFLTRWLVPHVSRFQTDHPDVELRMTSSLSQIDLSHSDMDMAIFYGNGNWKGLTSHLLIESTIVPLCSPALMEKGNVIQSPEDLLNHTLIKVSKRDQEWEKLLSGENVRPNTPRKSMTFSNTSLAMGAALEGLGIVLADKHLAGREIKYGQLIQPLDIQLDNDKSFYLVYEEGQPLSKSMESFRDWIIEEMEKEKSELLED